MTLNECAQGSIYQPGNNSDTKAKYLNAGGRGARDVSVDLWAQERQLVVDQGQQRSNENGKRQS